jgi:hypothetical protein
MQLIDHEFTINSNTNSSNSNSDSNANLSSTASESASRADSSFLTTPDKGSFSTLQADNSEAELPVDLKSFTDDRSGIAHVCKGELLRIYA